MRSLIRFHALAAGTAPLKNTPRKGIQGLREDRQLFFQTCHTTKNGVAQWSRVTGLLARRLTMCIPCCLRRETSYFLRHRSSSPRAASRGPRNLSVTGSAGREAVNFVAVVGRAAPHKEYCNIRYHALVKAPLVRSLATRTTWSGRRVSAGMLKRISHIYVLTRRRPPG